MSTKTLTTYALVALLVCCAGACNNGKSALEPQSEIMKKAQELESAIKAKEIDLAEILEEELLDALSDGTELTSDEKNAIVDASGKLEKAKAGQMKPFRKKFSQYLSQMNTKKNEFDEITWHSDKSSPEYSDVYAFYLYYGTNSDGSANGLRLRVQYTSDDWLFFDSFKVLADGKTQTLYPEEVERDNGGGSIWEWSDEPLETYNEGEQLIADIINSKDAKIRFEGDQYYSIKPITQQQKQALKNVVFAFVANGGYFGEIEGIR